MEAAEQNQAPMPFASWAELSVLRDEDERQRRFVELRCRYSWTLVDGYWSAQLARDILAAKLDRVRAYARSYAAANQADDATLERPAISVSPPPEDAAPAPPAAPAHQAASAHQAAPPAQQHALPPLPEAPPPQHGTATAQPDAMAASLRAADDIRFASDPLDVQSTFRMRALDVSQLRALPFEPASKAPPVAEFARAIGAADPPPQRPETGQEHTAFHRPAPAPQEDLRAAEAASQWTVDQYACFRAELQAAGPHHDHVFNRYGLSGPRARELVTASWGRRLDADGPMRARFEAVLNEQNRLRRG